MSMEIKACTFISAADGTEWKIVPAGDGAVLSRRTGKKKLFFRSAEKKELGIEYLRNLDAFFGAFAPEAAPVMAAGGDLVRVLCANGTIAISSARPLPEGAEGLFDDLRRYFAACFAGTAEPVRLSFSSFDGGGPEFDFTAETGGVFTWTARRDYPRADHDQPCGAGYDAIFTLYPLRKGSAEGLLTFAERRLAKGSFARQSGESAPAFLRRAAAGGADCFETLAAALERKYYAGSPAELSRGFAPVFRRSVRALKRQLRRAVKQPADIAEL